MKYISKVCITATETSLFQGGGGELEIRQLYPPKSVQGSVMSNYFKKSLMVRDVYRYQKSILYVLSIHCFDKRYVSSKLICSKYQANKFPC